VVNYLVKIIHLKKFFCLILLTTAFIIGKAQPLYKEVAQINDSVDYYLEIAIFNKEDKKSYNKAIIYTEKAIDYAKNEKLEHKLGDCYLVLGRIYYDLNKLDDAIENFIRSINIYTKKEANYNLAFAYYNLGKCYLESNKIELSEIYFKKATNIYEKLNLKDAIQLINLQKGIIQKNKKQYEAASKLFQNVIDNIETEALLDVEVEAFLLLGEIETEKGNPYKAIEFLESALKLNASGNNNTNLQQRILKDLMQAYKNIDQFSKSQFYAEKYIQISDSIGNFFNTSLYENAYDKIQFDKQLQTIQQLDEEKKSQQKTLRFSKLISILSIALISILSLLSLSLFKNNKIRINTNKLLKEKNKELIKEKEKAELASKTRSEFLATVSHELRTPLNAINGITYLLLQEKPKESQMNYLKSLEFSGNYLLNFINDILEINRLESDKVQIEKISFNINELVENLSTSFNEFTNENNVTFHVSIDKSIKNLIVGDITKLSQVLINLINNAIKFSKNGDVWLNIKNTHQTENQITLFFEVKDNGIGIPFEKQESIFESFSQGSVEINRTYGGTGLGLSIVKKLIELLDSTIKLQSEPNKGTAFTFEITFDKGNSLENTSSEEVTTRVDGKTFKNKNVLLVEDNKINQMITCKMLERKAINCTIIDNGEEAIEHLKTNTYDLVLMDVHLPGINGTEATAIIRTFDTKTPIIALTAISLNENREMLLSYGMNEVITKPFVPEDFYTVLASYLTKTEE
jgi:signal transduction histidine kinase/CheY-like chemotaxis protein